jgi:transposase
MGRGRPSTYSKKFHPLLIEQMAQNGLTDEQMAEKLGISTGCFYKWKLKYPEIVEALKRGKQGPDDKVERSLFERACGYEHKETKMFFDSKTGEVVKEDTTKHYPPDTAAAFIWLKNRRPKKWRDKQEIEQTTKVILIGPKKPEEETN